MTKPYGASEFDGYTVTPPTKDQPPLTKEEEDKIIAETKERIKREIAARNEGRSRKIS